MSNYVEMALEMGAAHAQLITSEDLAFDPRTYLKCIGCSSYGTWRCPPNQPSYNEAEIMLKKYTEIVLIHGHDKFILNKIARSVEKQAFLDGNYFAFALCGCFHCKKCKHSNEGPCENPDFRRPNSYSFGIDIYKTVRKFSLPIQVLKSEDEEPNRYAFVLIK